MRVVIAGGSGLIGKALTASLLDHGHDVRLLVRRAPAQRTDGASEVGWDPGRHLISGDALDGAAAVVNLAGSPVSARWSAAGRSAIRESRVSATTTLAEAIAGHGGPLTLVQGSAIGVYGNRGEAALDESSATGSGFLADVVRDWESAADPARRAGARVVSARTGIVLSADGGAAARLIPLIRLGLGGPLGNGRQWWSWITLRDEVRAIEHLLAADVEGPANLTAPHPARQRDVARALAQACSRPSVLRVPGWALRAAVGGFAGEILASQRVLPRALTASGFRFDDPLIEEAAPTVLRTV